MSIEQLTEPFEVIHHPPTDHNTRLTEIYFVDGSLVSVLHLSGSTELEWPTAVSGKDFLAHTVRALGLPLPEEVDGISSYTDHTWRLNTSELPPEIEPDTGIRFSMPEADIDITWINNAFNVGTCPEGCIRVPDLSAIDLDLLLAATGSLMVVSYQTRILDEIRKDMHPSLSLVERQLGGLVTAG